MPSLWTNHNSREMASRPTWWPTIPSNFMQKVRKIKWTDFEKCAKNLIFGPSPVLFLNTPEHECLFCSIIFVKTDRCIYFIYYLKHFSEKWAKSVNGSWDIDKKVIFACKMPPFWKNQNFRKMAARLILWPTMPSNFMHKISKIKWTDFDKCAQNPIFRTVAWSIFGHARAWTPILKHNLCKNW